MFLCRLSGRFPTIFEDVYLGGGGRDALFQQPLTQQGVDNCRLAGIELADDDQQKEFVQLGQGPLQRREVFGRGFKTGQSHGQRRHLTALFL